ncbi:MAG: hypothetical protein ABFC34_16060 [Methanobacterium sp.]
MKRCSICVLPETTPNITFDDEGVCNYCHSYRKFHYKGEDQLLELLEAQKKKDNKYDCMVNISGGRDSAFTLLKLVKDYNMNPLVVNYRNSFTDPQARINIKNATEILGVDLVSFDTKPGVAEETFRHSLKAWIRKPSPAMVPMMCVACKNMWWDTIKIAKKNDIKCIISGGNPLEESSFKKELLNVSRDSSYDSHFTSTIKGIFSEILRNTSYINLRQLHIMIWGYLFGNQYSIGPKIYAHNIERVDLFHYIPWNEDEILSRIKSELNWDYPHHLESTWRFDCQIGHLKDLLYIKTIGLTEKDEFYSRMIRENMITRDEALERLKIENKLHFDEVELLLKKAGFEDDSMINSVKGL